jgi:hypothetical protein
MKIDKTNSNNKQAVFVEMITGILIYAVVLGFFNDYTSILDTRSYSTTFFVALVMQLLTYLTFYVKKRISRNYSKGAKLADNALVLFGVWLVLFLSKFVFLAAIDIIFGENVQISGFVGLVAIIVSMTVVKELIDFGYKKLAD